MNQPYEIHAQRALLCQLCGSAKHAIGYTDSKNESKRSVLACPRCDAVNVWPRWAASEPK